MNPAVGLNRYIDEKKSNIFLKKYKMCAMG